jgi:hypothetical protein
MRALCPLPFALPRPSAHLRLSFSRDPYPRLQGYTFFAKDDASFTDSAFRLAILELGIKPNLQARQFLSKGFCGASCPLRFYSTFGLHHAGFSAHLVGPQAFLPLQSAS